MAITKPLKGVSFNAQWPGYSSTRLKALSWPVRMKSLVTAVKKQNPDIILVQEMGKAEAAAFFAALQIAMGRRIGYERSHESDTDLGLNCVGWCKDVLTWQSSINIDLPDFDQYPGRSALIVKVRDKKNNRLRLASAHNPVKTNADPENQQGSIQKFASRANDDANDWPLVVGVDTNNRQPQNVGMWSVLKDYGYKWKSYGIDAVFTNFGANAAKFFKTDLGTASDHDMLVFEVTTTKA